MHEFKEITPETKRKNRITAVVFLVCSIFISLLSFASFAWEDVPFPWFLFVIGLAGIVLSVYIWKTSVELTEFGVEEDKRRTQRQLSAWHFRYPYALFCMCLALISYQAWLSEQQFSSAALILALNPISGVLWAILALISAKELSLFVIACALGYFVFIGVAALPVSVAILLGAGIVALTIYKVQT
jgi:hypothetical protein